MAFTPTEEEVLRNVMSAYQGGKRMMDLPDAVGTNPFDMYTEVTDVDGESKKCSLGSYLPYLEDQVAYGIEWNVDTKEVRRVGNMALHKSLPIQSRMRGCLLDDLGKVAEYLNPATWEGHVRDGSKGQVMVEVETLYAQWSKKGPWRRTMISEYPVPGYIQVPKQYIGAYQGTVQRSTGKLCSVVNTDPDYRGGQNKAEWDGTYRTLLGVPVSQMNRVQFRAAARKRGDEQWNCLLYSMHTMLFWLFAIEYCTLDSQKPFNAQLTPEGYHQGGLGVGVSTLTDSEWKTFNSNNPFVPCGYTDSLGNESGEIELTLNNELGEEYKRVMVNRYRGVELPYGHIWMWTDGINIRNSADKDKGGDGTTTVYVCDDPKKFSDGITDGYQLMGPMIRMNDWIGDIVCGGRGILLANKGGSVFGDYCYAWPHGNGTATSGVLVGGHANHATSDGFACAATSYGPTHAFATIGSRLCFLPRKRA